MFFTDQEKSIYESPLGGKYDPLVVDRKLRIATGNRFDALVAARNAPLPDATGFTGGDVSASGRASAAVAAAEAELALSEASRVAFDLPPFPDSTMGVCLEVLYHYLRWMEGKGETAWTPQSTPSMEDGSNSELTTNGLPFV